MAGAVLQRLTGNPLASPEVIGVSGGAGIGFAIALTILPHPIMRNYCFVRGSAL